MPLNPAQLIVQHMVSLRGYEAGLQQKIAGLLNRAMREITSLLTTSYADLTQYQRTRLAEALKQFEAILGKSYSQVIALSTKELQTLAMIEGRYTANVVTALTANAGVAYDTAQLTAAQLKAIAQFPVNGAKAGEWWATQGANAAFQVRRNIQLGLLRGETTPQIARRLLSTESGGAVGGVAGMVERNAMTLVRTSITAISNEAQFQSLSAQDPKVTDSYQFVATLDDRTTIQCASLDGQIFRYDDESAPRPPLHPNCRSTIVAVVNWEELGVKPPEDIVALQRASMNGPTSYQTYSGWLRKQDAATQDDVLGATRGRLFRSGDVSLRDLVNSRNEPLTLDQLAKKLGTRVDEL